MITFSLKRFSGFLYLKSRRSKCNVIFVLFCSFLGLHILSDRKEKDTFEDKGGMINLTNICLPNENALQKQDFLVNTDKCRIPKLDIWSEDAKRHPVIDSDAMYNCNWKDLKITFVQGNEVVINTSALETLGYNLGSVSCCYKAIYRLEQSLTSYDEEADQRFRYSRKCTKMSRITQPTARHIKVFCSETLLSVESYSYVNFHIIPLLHEDHDKSDLGPHQKYENAIGDKIKFWNDCKENVTSQSLSLCHNTTGASTSGPPNVLIIGIDSVSRMNFQRFMKKTMKILKSIGAIEMQGFTKVGLNTLPNFIVSMTSHSRDDIGKICFANDSDPFDDCPFIWRNFSQQNYLTALMEDCPALGMFNYIKTGFVEQPTDIYTRPLMIAMYKYLNGYFGWKWDLRIKECMKYQRPEEMILQAAADLALSVSERGLPFFIATWLTDLTHEEFNAVERMDGMLSEALEKLWAKNVLKNTLLIVMSDHGYRFLPIRWTLSGFYEEKLPALWIRVPESIQERIVGSKENVVKNVKSLISPYDIHATLKHILMMNAKKIESPHEAFRVGKGISLFSEIPPRSCEESGIPPEYCACQPLLTFNHDNRDDIIRTAANAVVGKINDALRSSILCYSQRLSYVFSSCIIREDLVKTQLQSQSLMTTMTENDLLVVGFVTTPGKIFWESHVGFDPGSRSFTKVVRYTRTNKILDYPSCIEWSEDLVKLEQLCVCKWWAFW